MKIPMNIIRLSAGKIEDNGMLYSNAIVLDDDIANLIEPDRIDVGQKDAKVSMSTDNHNQLAKELAHSGLIPSVILCDVETTVKKNVMTMKIVGFENKQLKQA